MAQNEPHQYTMEEIRGQFLHYIRGMILFWNKEGLSKTNALEGLAFSILVALDGEAADVPAFAVLPISSIEDQKYLREQGGNWYPLLQIDNEYDIAGSLHDHLFKGEAKKMEHILSITTRELKEIDHAMHYATFLAHGTAGHNQLMLIANLAVHLGFHYSYSGDQYVLEIPENVHVDDGPTTKAQTAG